MTITEPDPGLTHPAPERGGSPLRRTLGVLALDIAVPTGAYYVLQALGFGVVASLAISSALAGVRVLWSLARERHADAVALFVLVVTVVSIPVSFVVGSPQLMLAKEELGIPPMGLYLLVSGLRGIPGMTAMIRPWVARTTALDAAFGRLIARPGGELTRAVCRTQIVYGLVFLATSATRLTLIFTLPIDTAVWVSGLVLPAGIVLAILAAIPFTGRAGALVEAEAGAEGGPR
ncbi:MAG: hypothetical protein L0I76_11270 [Pseudonocardia sp.]|nr:hypothetical protein [Pseudonocardia sp.]